MTPTTLADDTGVLHVLSQLGPIATGVPALVALGVGYFTVRQRGQADRRDQWWKRAQWALDLVLTASDDEGQAAVGYAVLNQLAESDLAKNEELLVLQAAWGVWLFDTPPEEEEEARDDG